MRKLLGFTVREHREYVVNNKFTEQQARGEDAAHGHYIDVVHLDFYSESRRTFFLMKYSELINNDGKKI